MGPAASPRTRMRVSAVSRNDCPGMTCSETGTGMIGGADAVVSAARASAPTLTFPLTQPRSPASTTPSPLVGVLHVILPPLSGGLPRRSLPFGTLSYLLHVRRRR